MYCMASGVQPSIGGLALNIMEWILWYICITVDLSTYILKYALALVSYINLGFNASFWFRSTHLCEREKEKEVLPVGSKPSTHTVYIFIQTPVVFTPWKIKACNFQIYFVVQKAWAAEQGWESAQMLTRIFYCSRVHRLGVDILWSNHTSANTKWQFVGFWNIL